MTTQQPRQPSIDLLLNLLPDRPDSILSALQSHPALASASDVNGYTLLHAASSYAHLDVLRALVRTYSVNPDIRDNDGDTPLFYAETRDVAQCLAEELGADMTIQNEAGETALDRVQSADYMQPDVAAYLKEKMSLAQQAGSSIQDTSHDADGALRAPPPLPDGVKINLGSMAPEDAEELPEPDPEFKARIEELAGRANFQSDEVQRELRELVSDAVRGVAADQNNGPRSSRRRVE